MSLRIRETGQVITEGEFRSLHNNTSFPPVLTPEIINDFGVDPILPAPQPTPGEFEVVAREGTVQDTNGNWIENWVLKPMFTEYTDPQGVIHTVAEQEATFTANKLATMRQGMVVSPFQAKAALLQAGLLTQVEALINDPATDPLVVLAWNNASEYRRTSPMIISLGTELGLNDTQLDDLFMAAAQITA